MRSERDSRQRCGRVPDLDLEIRATKIGQTLMDYSVFVANCA